MHCISSKYRKHKGRPTKRSKAGSANILKHKSFEMQPIDPESIEHNNPETVPETSLDVTDQCDSLSAMATEDSFVSNPIWADLLQNVPCSECQHYKLNVVKHNSFGFSSKLELVCETCTKSYGYVYSSEREAPTKKFKQHTDSCIFIIWERSCSTRKFFESFRCTKPWIGKHLPKI